MQTTNNRDLAKRSRYYQGILDLNHIEKGRKYRELPRTVIIFICTFDYFGKDLPVYVFENRCVQDTALSLEDETCRIFVNLKSRQVNEKKELSALFNYLNKHDVSDEYTMQLQMAVINARGNNGWEVEYMQNRAYEMDIEADREDAIKEGHEKGLAEGLAEGRSEGLAEGRAEGISIGENGMLFKLVIKQIITLDQALEQSGMAADEFQKKYADFCSNMRKVY